MHMCWYQFSPLMNNTVTDIAVHVLGFTSLHSHISLLNRLAKHFQAVGQNNPFYILFGNVRSLESSTIAAAFSLGLFFTHH